MSPITTVLGEYKKIGEYEAHTRKTPANRENEALGDIKTEKREILFLNQHDGAMTPCFEASH